MTWLRMERERAEFPSPGGAHTMNKVILADSQAIFRAGTAKVLAMDEDLRIIAQCSDLERLYHAISHVSKLNRALRRYPPSRLSLACTCCLRPPAAAAL